MMRVAVSTWLSGASAVAGLWSIDAGWPVGAAAMFLLAALNLLDAIDDAKKRPA